MANNTIITIARQYGSGGHDIGEKLAEELKIPFYDKELLERAAKDSGFCQFPVFSCNGYLFHGPFHSGFRGDAFEPQDLSGAV